MFRPIALVHLGVLLAWSVPWTCQTYALPDGGATNVTPTGGTNGGNGGRSSADASVPVVYAVDGGSGLAAGSDGGVTVGSSAAFTSNFVYMANADEGTVSRIVLPPDGGAPFEEARYFGIVPIDNHGEEPCVAATGCIKTDAGTLTDIWHYQHASYVVNPSYTVCVPFDDGGYAVSVTTTYKDGGYAQLVTTSYNDGGYALTIDAGYFNDGGYSVANVAVPYNDGGYSLVLDAGYFNDGGYRVVVDIPETDGGYTLTEDAGYFNDGGYSVKVSVSYDDGGYSATIDAGYFNDGGYTKVTTYNDGGYTLVEDAGYFNDGGYTNVTTTSYSDGGYSLEQVLQLGDGGYSKTLTFYDGGALWRTDAGVVLTDGGEYAGTVYFDDGGYSADAGIAYNDGGYSITVDAGYNDGGYDKTASVAFADGGYSQDAGYNDGGYDKTASVTYDDGGYSKNVDAGESDGGYELTIGVAFDDAGYTRVTDAGYADGGYDLTVTVSYNDGGYNRSQTVAYNDAGYGLTAVLSYVDGGYSVTWDAGFDDGGYSLTDTTLYGDGGYCTNQTFGDGGTPFIDGGNVDQLALANGADDQPSRTVVDRNGNVWVVLRSTDGTNYFQSGITKIIDVDDNLTECTPRCTQRTGLKPNQVFTEGVPLRLSGGGTVTLSPPTVIAPGTSYATTYACQDTGHDNTGRIETDAVNYDDCVSFSIPLGAPYPDPNADPHAATASLSFGRGAAISPNCNPSTGDCDVWVGMWNDAGWIRLSYNGTGLGTGAPFDVGSVINPGASPYGAAVDCAGIIWGTGNNAEGQDVLTATSTIAVNDPAYNVSVPAYTVLSNFAIVSDAGLTTLQFGIPKPSQNDHYGIASDIQERIWSAAGDQGAYASSFSAVNLFTLLGASDGGIVSSSAWSSMLNLGWLTYNFSNIAPEPSNVPFGQTPPAGTFARGINVDKTGNVYVGMDVEPWQGGGQGLVSFTPNDAGSVPCILYDGGACPGVQLNWAYERLDAGGHGGSVGVDIDAQGNPWLGNYGQPQGLAQRFNAANGSLMSEVPVGNGTYSYSDFTGYALRYITLASAVSQTAIPGCGVSPELTAWNSLSYTAAVPAGTDMRLDVKVVDDLNPVVLSLAHDYEVCDSVTNPASPTSCPRNSDGSINLGLFNLPQGSDLVVYVTMTPTVCGSSRGDAAAPTLYHLGAGTTCIGD